MLLRSLQHPINSSYKMLRARSLWWIVGLFLVVLILELATPVE
ncbi:hypothetical protein [Chroococcidiopsis sp. TS-821]|nr:hypothetical protein [Chroococcidiopsis sp. TS-821]